MFFLYHFYQTFLQHYSVIHTNPNYIKPQNNEQNDNKINQDDTKEQSKENKDNKDTNDDLGTINEGDEKKRR